MGLKKVDFSLIIDEKKVSEKILDAVISIELEDKIGFSSDTLNVSFYTEDEEINIKKGQVIEPQIGYKNDCLTKYGKYIVADIEFSKNKQNVNCVSFPAKGLKEVTHELFKGEENIETILTKICKKTSITIEVCEQLKNKTIKDFKTSNETKLHAILRLSKKVGAYLKVNDNKLIMVKRNTGKTVSGQNMPELEINAEDIENNWQAKFNDSEDYYGIIARYQGELDKMLGKSGTIKTGKEPYFEIKKQFSTKVEATDAANEKLAEIQRSKGTLSFELEGNPKIRAERIINVIGFNSVIDKEKWLIESVSHSISGGVYKTKVNCCNSIKENSFESEDTQDE